MDSINLTMDNFDQEVINASEAVLVDFWAPWCGPCKMMAPILEEFAKAHEKIKVCKLNVDDNMELAGKYGITNIPTLVVFKNGKITNKAVGVQSMDALERML